MKKDRRAAGLLSLVLWAALAAVLVYSFNRRGGWRLVEGLILLLHGAALAVVGFFCWWMIVSRRLNRMTRRLEAAGFDYLRTRDADRYLRELDGCLETPGIRRMVLGGIPAGDYVTVLKIRTLGEAGRGSEARALLERTKQDARGERTLLLLRREEEELEG